jgi:hypothetical protein
MQSAYVRLADRDTYVSRRCWLLTNIFNVVGPDRLLRRRLVHACTRERATTMVCDFNDGQLLRFIYRTHLTPHAPLAPKHLAPFTTPVTVGVYAAPTGRKECVGRAPRQPLQVSGVRGGDSASILTAIGRKTSLLATSVVNLLLPGGQKHGAARRCCYGREVRFDRGGWCRDGELCNGAAGGSNVWTSESEIDN